jgi:hypothetical protein
MDKKINYFLKNENPSFLKNNELMLLSKKVPEEESMKYRFFKKSLSHFISVSNKLKLTDYTIMKIKKIPKAHSDIDILTTSENISKISEELQKENFFVSADLGYEKTLTKQFESGRIIIDLHSNVQYNKCDFLDPKEVIKRKTRLLFDKNEIPFVSPEDDFIITMIHSMFQKISYFRADYDKFRWTEFTLNDLYQMNHAIKSEKFDLDYVLRTAKEFCWEEALLYSLIILDQYFPDKKNKRFISKIKIKNSIRKRLLIDVKKNKNLPFYTSTNIMYLITLIKSRKEFRKSKLNGLLTFIKYQKWFVVNLGRYLRNKIKNNF